jgi:hypothetical protein
MAVRSEADPQVYANLIISAEEMAEESEETLRRYGITRKELAERAGYKSLGGNTNPVIDRILKEKGLQVNNRGRASYIGHIPEE